MNKRHFAPGLGLLAAAAWATSWAQARATPIRSADTLVVPYGAGGPTDAHLRVVAKKPRSSWANWWS
jgi:tripartite-type tricarboxylate transporter receptor subunit TctC